jgi:protein-S-isoprenylcysteine O-methyltransferase Ste14
MTKRISIFVFGVVSYAAFFVTFLYAIGFIGNMYVPKTLDSAARLPFWQALLVDTLLLGVFAVQHSVMARPAFKRVLTRFIPEAAERSAYVLMSSLALIALFIYWQPIGGVIWRVADPAARNAINVVYGLGFALVFVSTLLINHFDLFGLRQVWLQLVGTPYTHLEFRTPLFYRYVRHPLYVGWFIAFWSTPTMTGAHLLFAVMTSAYILMAIRWEERDLVMVHGAKYENYRKEVPKLVPSLVPYQAEEKSLLQGHRRMA